MTERTNHFAGPDTAETIRIGARIRARRQELKMTLEDVAGKSSLSPGFLSLVERDLSYPSLATLVRIAQAIKTPVEDLMSLPKGEGSISKASKRKLVEVNEGGVKFGRLSAEFPGAVLNAVEITLPPHYSSETASHTGEEFFYVLSGVLTQMLDDAETELHPGDCAHFQSIVPHRWANRTDDPVKLLWVGDLPIFPPEG